MRKVTEDDVREMAHQRVGKPWIVRRCSICGAHLLYYFFLDHVEFDPSCDCAPTRGLFERRDRRTHQEFADFLNMQTPEVRGQLWEGLTGNRL
jgi:hypothetical protein